MQVSEARKLAAQFRYLRTLTKRLLREDRFILPLYLITVLFAAEAAAVYALISYFPALQDNGVVFLIATAVCTYMIADSPFGRIGLRHVAIKLGIKSVSVHLSPAHERIAAHIRPVLGHDGQHRIVARYAMATIYIALLIVGRTESKLLHELEKSSNSSTIRGLLLRR